MEVTALNKLENGMYEVVLSTGETLKVHEESVVTFGLLPGKHLESSQLQELKVQLVLDGAYLKAIHFISYKMRTCHEVAEKLGETYDDTVVGAVLERLMNEGYINDVKFAEAMKNTLLNTTDKGPMELMRSLRLKGVDREIIETFVERFDASIDRDRMNAIKDKMLKKHKGSYKMFINKVKERCMIRGYQPHHIQLIRFDDEHNDLEADNLERDYRKSYNKYQKKHTGYALKTKIFQSLLRQGYSYDDIQDKLGGLDNEF